MLVYIIITVLTKSKNKDKEEAVIINPKFMEDYEIIDFNNAYCKLLWEECEEK